MLRTSVVFTLAILAACGDGGATDPGVDAAPALDAPLAIDGPGTCDPTTALPTQWRPIAMVSTGTVAVTTVDGVTTGTLDATAGGGAASADNPYVYVDLMNGTKVELSDVAALSSRAWHLALKRSSLKLNGGDSGPGGVTGAPVPAETLAEVTAVPAGLTADDWASEACAFNGTPGGEPASVMGDWYDYDGATHALTPQSKVWVIKLGDSASAPVRKLRLTTYYGDPAMPMRGAYYGVEWAAL